MTDASWSSTGGRTVATLLAVLAGIAIVGLAAGSLAGVVGAQDLGGTGVDRGEPDLSVELPDNQFEPGTATAFEFQVGNDADVIAGTGTEVVTTARSVTLEVTDDGPFDVQTARTPVGAEGQAGTIPDGQYLPATAEVEIPDDVEPGVYEIEVEVRYSYSDRLGASSGESRDTATESHDVTVVVTDDYRFEVGDVADTLAVGYDGEVTGTVDYRGNETVDDAVLVVEPMSESLYVEDSRYALPEMKPNASTEFRYPVDVSGSADDGPRQLRFTVEYTDRVGVDGVAGPFSERVHVDSQVDEFSIADDGVTVPAGEERELTLTITNERPETLSNVDARLYDESPLSATNDAAFVSELEPGESAELTFAVEADEDASTETHPVDLDFEYDTERGETVLSDRYRHGIDVGPPNDDDGGVSGTVVGLLAAISVALAGVAMWWIRR